MATTSIDDIKVDTKPIPRLELLEYRADVKLEIFRQIRRRFNYLAEKFGFKQGDLAQRLSLDKGLLSKRLKGENDMRLETLSDLARGLDCRIDVMLTPLDKLVTVAQLGGMQWKFITSVTAEVSVEEDQEPKPITIGSTKVGSAENVIGAHAG